MIPGYKIVTDQQIVSFADGIDVPIKSLECEFAPKQSLNGQANPYPAGGGKNLLNYADFSVSYRITSVTDNGNGTFVVVANENGAYIDHLISVTAGQTYRIKAESVSNDSGNASQMSIASVYDGNDDTATNLINRGSIVNGKNFTPTGNTVLVRNFVTGGSGAGTGTIVKPQLEVGTTTTNYAPYANICPITGWTGASVYRMGVNQWDEQTILGYFNDSGIWTSRNDVLSSKNAIKVTPGEDYYIVCPNATFITYWKSEVTTSSAPTSEFISRSQVTNATHQFTIPSNCNYIFFNLPAAYGATYNNDVSVNYPSTSTTYEAYKGNTYSVTWQNSAGTVYGGTFDFATGVLTATHKLLTITGNEGITYNTYGTSLYTGDTYFLTDSVDGVDIIGLCSMVKQNDYQPEKISKTYLAKAYSNRGIQFYKTTEYWGLSEPTSAALIAKLQEWNTNGTPLQICYKLATPITYQLTAQDISTLVGQNNIFANTGNIKKIAYGNFSYYNDLLAQESGQHIRVTFLVDNVVFEDEDFCVSGDCTLTSYLNPDTDLTFGVANMSEMSLTFFRSLKTDQLNWTREFKVEFGVEDGEEISWVTVGIFAGSRPITTKTDTITFTGYDRMKRFDSSAKDFFTTLTYPCTLQDIYDNLCSFVGITNTTGDEIATVMSRSFSSAFDSSNMDTCRDVLAKIAEANGCYAKITNDGKVKLVWFEDHQADYDLLRDNMFSIDNTEMAETEGVRWRELANITWAEMASLQWGELFHTENPLAINAVTATWSSPDLTVTEPDPPPTGANIITLSNNPFIYYSSTNDIRSHLNLILTRMLAFDPYYVANVVSTGNWLIEPGDLIRIELDDGTYAIYPIFSRTLSWNGACECNYECTGNLKRQS